MADVTAIAMGIPWESHGTHGIPVFPIPMHTSTAGMCALCRQEVTSDAISRVSSYNWTGSTPARLRALLLDISRYNDTAWDIYSHLDRTLDHTARQLPPEMLVSRPPRHHTSGTRLGVSMMFSGLDLSPNLKSGLN